MDYDKRRLMNYISDQKYFQETSLISVKRLSKRKRKSSGPVSSYFANLRIFLLVQDAFFMEKIFSTTSKCKVLFGFFQNHCEVRLYRINFLCWYYSILY